MGGKQRIYKQRIRSTQTLKKVFRAMELIAASRIGKARHRAQSASPYDAALTQAISLLSAHADFVHPLTQDPAERAGNPRVAVLVVAADRGMAGSYSATVLREAERLTAQLVADGREPVLYVAGRRAAAYFRFRGRPVEHVWSGNSDSPTEEDMHEIAQVLYERYIASPEDGGVAEVHMVYTRFVSMVSQVPQVRRMLPMLVVDELAEEDPSAAPSTPLYEFEPSANEVLDALLPIYVRSRIRNALLQSAASELAARQQAMHTATDNAEELIRDYTRLANSARQAEITQEISEIVSGADALAAS
ncbi:MAG: F0F1 ATP synthase subunit gamma [Buchananella hordeovulneris]|nr:F0F1 ATP synthase subunit gamma [Buchananella hordeovulneris]